MSLYFSVVHNFNLRIGTPVADTVFHIYQNVGCVGFRESVFVEPGPFCNSQFCLDPVIF